MAGAEGSWRDGIDLKGFQELTEGGVLEKLALNFYFPWLTSKFRLQKGTETCRERSFLSPGVPENWEGRAIGRISRGLATAGKSRLGGED